MTFQLRRPTSHGVGLRTTPRLADFLAFLDANPNTRAVYHTYTSRNSATYRRRTARRAFSHLGYEFIERTEPHGYTIYGRKVDVRLAHPLAS